MQVHVLMSLMDIASGMAYLHSVGILHGDLKSANVLLKSTATDLRGYSCKIADFGCGKAQSHLSLCCSVHNTAEGHACLLKLSCQMSDLLRRCPV